MRGGGGGGWLATLNTIVCTEEMFGWRKREERFGSGSRFDVRSNKVTFGSGSRFDIRSDKVTNDGWVAVMLMFVNNSRSCGVGYSTQVPAGIYPGMYPTQLMGRLVLLSVL